jgi:formate-dependent nitrite reductase membrane component NrfD
MILLLLFLVLVVLASFASRVESSKGIKDGPIHKLLGGILIAAGILISGTSGLCSVYIVASGLWNQPNGMEWILL